MISIEPLNVETGLGLFLLASSCSTRALIVPSCGSMVLVQLDPATNHPAFSCICLGEIPVEYGIRITCQISFDFPCKMPMPDNASDTLGAIISDGCRMGLNCRTLDGTNTVVWLQGVKDAVDAEVGNTSLPAFPWVLHGENEIGEPSEYFRFGAPDGALAERLPSPSIH